MSSATTVVAETIVLPELSGGRIRARAIVDALGASVRGKEIILDCRQLLAGSQSFADELVSQVLKQRGAATLRVMMAPPDFEQYLVDAAKDHGVCGRLVFM